MPRKTRNAKGRFVKGHGKVRKHHDRKHHSKAKRHHPTAKAIVKHAAGKQVYSISVDGSAPVPMIGATRARALAYGRRVARSHHSVKVRHAGKVIASKG